MIKLTKLEPYQDENGNSIEYDGPVITKNVKIEIRGHGNRLVVRSPARIDRLTVLFDCNNGVVEVDENTYKSGSYLRLNLRVGEDSTIRIGKNVTMTGSCFMTAAEGTSITVGDDCMIATANEIRTHDGHPIFELSTGERANKSRSIEVGNHVWLAKEATLLGGSKVGDGSVIGFRAVVTGTIPNNCVAVGLPAKVTKRDIAWERPNLTLTKPYYKPDSSTVSKTRFWNPTVKG